MKHKNRFLNAAVAGLALAVALASAGNVHAEDYGPLNAAEALRQLPVLCRTVGIGCPISADACAALTGATGGDREAQFKLARLLQRGDGISRDEQAATGWFGKAAEQGQVAAALELNHLRREGVAIPADEAKIAAALGLAVERGDLDAMRALAEMQIEGRGLPRNPEQGLGLLRRAVAAGSALAAQDLANLYLRGAPGIPKDPPAGFRSMAASARLGNAAAMLELGSLYFNYPEPKMVDPAEGYRWLMRAALADDPAAQEMLSGALADGAMVGARTVIAPDLVTADVWLRLAARSRFHDNASLRRRIEANMTAAQLDEAQTRTAAWQPHRFGRC
jgi:TPR repeat protein